MLGQRLLPLLTGNASEHTGEGGAGFSDFCGDFGEQFAETRLDGVGKVFKGAAGFVVKVLFQCAEHGRRNGGQAVAPDR
ncbi:hypothetical protein D3C78_1034800 [compost metagenome]